MSSLRAVFFDWSGTLADDLGPVIDATNRVLGHHGLDPLDRDSFRAQFRLPYADFYAEVLPGVPIGDLEDIYRHHHAASQERAFLLPGSVEILEWCQQHNLKIFLCSSAHEEGWRQQAGDLGVEAYFDQAYTGVRDKVASLGEFLSEHHLSADEAVFVGDMLHDVYAAQRHGLISVALSHGYDPRDRLETAGADFLCDDLAEVRGVLAALRWLGPQLGPSRPQRLLRG